MIFDEQYLTYSEYIDLGGELEEMPFNLLELKARKIIDNATFNRLKHLDKQIIEVKACIFELIETIYNVGNNKTSESIDGYSVSYNNISDTTRTYADIVREHLLLCQLPDGTPYLYCGVV